jgi:SAM-dependent methyltransferase
MSGLDWSSLARSADGDELREQILAGYKSGKPFTPYVPTLDLPSPIGAVLDFGCGVGRNFPYLKTIADRVVGYDLPQMIARCRALAGEPVDLLMDDWTDVTQHPVDLIFAALVLQHIEPAACRSYLLDFAGLAPVVYLLTRAQSDFGPNVLELVAETGLFDAGECTQVDHDPQTHQLKVLGRLPFDAVRRADAGHYEVILRSKASAV